MDWQTTPHELDPAIAEAVDHINELLPVKRVITTSKREYREPLITARDCELAGFNLALVLEAAKGNAP